MALQQTKKEKEQETLDRLRAPTHVTQNLFTEHREIEGYFEDRSVPDFFGCDRLLKLDTLYGTTQLGYDPKRGQSFLFSNIKTSLYDTAASAYQRNIRQASYMKTLKAGTQNTAFSSRRREASATILFKAENKPWSEESVRHYMARVNLETLRKTMPFLDREVELAQREKLAQQAKQLGQDVTDALRQQEQEPGKAAALRAKQVELKTESETVGAILVRKQSQSRLFFRKINLAFDLQKQKMFEYYRNQKELKAEQAEISAVTADKDEDNEDN